MTGQIGGLAILLDQLAPAIWRHPQRALALGGDEQDLLVTAQRVRHCLQAERLPVEGVFQSEGTIVLALPNSAPQRLRRRHKTSEEFGAELLRRKFRVEELSHLFQ